MTSFANSEMLLKPVENIVTRKNDNGSVILMKMDDSDNFYKIEGVASFIWREAVDNCRSIGEIFDQIIKTHDVEPAQLDKDIKKLIDDLQSNQLIVE